MQNNLTTLANASTWLGVTNADDNSLLTRLIGSSSRSIHNYLQRPSLFQNTFNEVYDGTGSTRLMLRNFPVLSIASLSVGGQSISKASAFGQVGYTLETWNGFPPGNPQSLNLCGARFSNGRGNVAVSYIAGYAVQNEPQTVSAAPCQIIAYQPQGTWGADQGVTYASTGLPLTPVPANPAQGQYVVRAGRYIFAAADAGQNLLLSYSFIPADIEQACIELVGERYRTRDRIGQTSKTLGGQETVAFSTDSMNKYVRELLQPFRHVVPI